MRIKSNYKNAQNKWQEYYAKCFIEMMIIIIIIIIISKNNNNFQEISKDFIKRNWINDLNLFI